jgi:hypothetical protein
MTDHKPESSDSEMRKAPLAGRPIHISDAMTTLPTTATELTSLQERRLAKRFFLSPDVAATIARLHFGEVRA